MKVVMWLVVLIELWWFAQVARVLHTGAVWPLYGALGLVAGAGMGAAVVHVVRLLLSKAGQPPAAPRNPFGPRSPVAGAEVK